MGQFNIIQELLIFISISFFQEKKNLTECRKFIFDKIKIFSEEQDENENIDKNKPKPIRTSTPEPIEVNVSQFTLFELSELLAQ